MPPADFWDEEDEWYHSDRHFAGARHVRPHLRARDDGYGRRSELLTPDHTHTYSSGLHRTRSVGHSPAPNVTIYNTTRLDNESNPNVRTQQRSPGPSTSPRGRPLRMADEWAVEDELAQLRLEVARNRRSRSRSAHYHRDESPGYHHDHHNHELERYQIKMMEERLREQQEREHQEKREELIKKRIELKLLKDKQEREEEEARIKLEEDRLKKEWELKMEKEAREKARREQEAEEERKRILLEEERKREKKAREAEEERKRIINENQLAMERAQKEAEAARQAAVDAFNKEQAEKERKAREERERIIAEYERNKVLDAEKAKRQREELIMQLRIEEEKRKKEEEEEYQRFLQKQKQKEEEEKAKKAKKEQELEDAMRKRLAQFGFQENQIQAMIKPEEQAKLQQQQGMTPMNPLPRLTHQPTYVKVHKEHLSIDTLHYYDIPYEIDRADPNYIIILREMDNKETEILFEHTRRLRTRGTSRLLIEERHDHGKPEYAWVRRRKQSRSPSRRRSSPKRVVGIKEMFF
ncbi:uncharacterized protein EI97DRAFT_206846 [Westerdykella ornata]|uniref:Uncharacterized protein n=1 Tax=Westerdykella ornata TaxID=318751 RepID=A0A6A6J8B2_WESOR|nr:uncharacterized protein EI97DRAFT_206846 [Westerdykella ornata]KAF2272605.1 hypothetical protein EI97DRAFT_206846 [Westerdykella ornata]